MMSVKGIFEDGVIKLTEPVGLNGRHDVIITFLDTEKENAPIDKDRILGFAGMLNDLSEDEMEIFESSLKRRFSFNREIEL